MDIFLIRHAKPDITCKKGWCSYRDAQQYTEDFDKAAIEKIIGFKEREELRQVSRVYCSTLNRSMLTARALFPDKEIVAQKAFIEFERKVIRLPYLRLPIQWWLVISRILWALGLHKKDIETFRQARQRAKKCARQLEAIAEKESTTVLVAHGFLNKFIELALKKNGWKVISEEGIRHLGVMVLRKI